VALVLCMTLAVGCGRFLGDRVPPASAPAEVKRVTFEIVARENRCEPSVLAADRGGGSLLITLRVTSVGKQHVFLVPDLNIRWTIPPDTEVLIPVVADRSGIYQYGCTGLPWLGPLDARAS